jgi:hypothetical protein
VTLSFCLSVCSFVSDEGVCEIIKTFLWSCKLITVFGTRTTFLVSSRNVVTLSNYKSSLLYGVSGFFLFPVGFQLPNAVCTGTAWRDSSGRFLENSNIVGCAASSSACVCVS